MVDCEEIEGSVERRCRFQVAVFFARVFESTGRGGRRGGPTEVFDREREGCSRVEAQREIQVVRVSRGSLRRGVDVLLTDFRSIWEAMVFG